MGNDVPWGDGDVPEKGLRWYLFFHPNEQCTQYSYGFPKCPSDNVVLKWFTDVESPAGPQCHMSCMPEETAEYVKENDLFGGTTIEGETHYFSQYPYNQCCHFHHRHAFLRADLVDVDGTGKVPVYSYVK